MLYQVLAAHFETFVARVEADPDRGDLPRFVVRELRAFLDSGILARGFCRAHCVACGKDDLVAFACKRRGFCPSCGARRMADTAAHLVDHVLPAGRTASSRSTSATTSQATAPSSATPSPPPTTTSSAW